jgi:hypothetical protein
MCWFDKRGRLIVPKGMEAWGQWRGNFVRVTMSYEKGKWQTENDTIGDHSIQTCRSLIRQALQSGHEPIWTTKRAARLLREEADPSPEE